MEAGRSRAEIAEWLFVCTHTVARVWNKYKKLGSFEPEPQNSGRKPLVSEEVMDIVAAKVRETPDITLAELIDEFNLPISQVALSKRLIKMGFIYKKKHSIRVAAAGRISSKQEKRGGRVKKE